MAGTPAKVAHVVLDQKFIDNAIEIFDSLPGLRNEYLLVSRSGVVSQIRSKGRVTVFRSQGERLRHLRRTRPRVIILHSLFFGASLVPLVSGRTPLVWISWGADLYKDMRDALTSSFPFRYSLFMPQTRRWLDAGRPGARGRFKGAVRALARNVLRHWAIRKIGSVSTCLPYEYPLITRRFPHLRRFEFDYIDKTAQSLPRCDGLNVLIGNSASVNCNHLDVIDQLRGRLPAEAHVVVPLSYAGSAAYCKAVSDRGAEAFGERFMPLTTFMNIDEYTRLIRSCGIAVMGFLRQQATKNVQLLLSQGTRVFFYRDTEMYRYLKSEGYTVFALEDDLTPDNLRTLLPVEDVKKNQELVSRQFSYDGNLRNVTRSMNAILAGEA